MQKPMKDKNQQPAVRHIKTPGGAGVLIVSDERGHFNKRLIRSLSKSTTQRAQQSRKSITN